MKSKVLNFMKMNNIVKYMKDKTNNESNLKIESQIFGKQ